MITNKLASTAGDEAQRLASKFLLSSLVSNKCCVELQFVQVMLEQLNAILSDGWELLPTDQHSSADLAGADFIFKGPQSWWPIDVTLDMGRKMKWSAIRLSFCIGLELERPYRELSLAAKELMLRTILAMAAVSESQNSGKRQFSLKGKTTTLEYKVSDCRSDGMYPVTFTYGGTTYAEMVYSGLPVALVQPPSTCSQTAELACEDIRALRSQLIDLSKAKRIWASASDYALDLEPAIKFCCHKSFEERVILAMKKAVDDFFGGNKQRSSEPSRYRFSGSDGGTITDLEENLRVKAVVSMLEQAYIKGCNEKRKQIAPLSQEQGRGLLNAVLMCID